MKETGENSTWYKLDTSAKIYPAIESPRNTNVFRISMTLKENIRKNILAQALDDTKERFPYFNVHLKQGFFWNYLEQNFNPLIVWIDTPSPCERLYPVFNNGYLYKVRYYKKRIAVEFSHVITDGAGGMEFVKCLVNQYLVLIKKIDGKTEGIFDINQKPRPEEYEDAFPKVLEIEKDTLMQTAERSLFSNNKAFQIKDRLLPFGVYKVITGVISIDDIKKITKKYDVKITELLTALYMEALIYIQDQQIKNKKNHKNIAIQIPVNMRLLYDIKCMRNFSLFIIPTINPKEVNSFDDIILKVKEFMRKHVKKEHLIKMIKDNYSLGESKVVKSIPVYIKNPIVKYIFSTQGASQFSGTISNLGVIKLPKEIEDNVDEVDVILGSCPNAKCICSALGYKDKIHITFGRVIKDTYVEKHVFRRLVEMGANVEIRSN